MLECQQSDGPHTAPPAVGSQMHALQRVLTDLRAWWHSQEESMLVRTALQCMCNCMSC